MFTYAKSKGCAWGTIDTLPEIPGVALRSDGHVGVYVGDGYAVEERGFSYGCVKTKVSSRKWTHWFQLPFVDYGDAVFTGGSYVKPDTADTVYTLGTRTLKNGSKAAPDTETPEEATPSVKRVRIVCGSGSVNIRVGNDTKYGRITSVKDGTTFEWIATAENGWHAIVVNAQIGWVSGKYSEIIQ